MRPAPLAARRGPLTDFLSTHLSRQPHRLPIAPDALDDPWLGEDAPLALTLCFELAYRGIDGVDAAWEWEPSLIALRGRLERNFLARVVDAIGPPPLDVDVEAELRSLADDTSPSMSHRMAEDGTVEEFREFAAHRSVYQLKEADPHSFAIPRLSGRSKAALVLIQSDEYGEGRAAAMHSTLFAQTLRALGLDDRYGAHLDAVPGVTLSTVNLVSLFGLHRRWVGALVGHLALFEMASVGPNGRYGQALRRLGFGPDATEFYDVHVRADAVHEVVALRELVGGLLDKHPSLAGDVVFGARALSVVEAAFSAHLTDSWRAGRSSLRDRPARRAAA